MNPLSAYPLHLADLYELDKPADDSEAVGDPYKTLFISRLVSDFHLVFG